MVLLRADIVVGGGPIGEAKLLRSALLGALAPAAMVGLGDQHLAARSWGTLDRDARELRVSTRR